MYTYQDIAFGITTFNRRRLVEAQGRSLKLCIGIDDARLFVIDDQSREFTPEDLRHIYPNHARVMRRTEPSGGADFAVELTLRFLVEMQCRIMVILDSDLVCSAAMLDEIIRLLPKTSGFFSLFNTPSHPTIGTMDEFAVKRSVGSAGWVMTHDMARRLLEANPPGVRFDWRCCEFLQSIDVPVLSVKQSLVQHAGFAAGQFSNYVRGDFGVGFLDGSPVNMAALNESMIFAMRTGFADLLRRFETQQRDIAGLKAELALHKAKLGL